jgi:hypothetical protein
MANEHFAVIGDFFVNKPLYARVSVVIPRLPGNLVVRSILPPLVSRECEGCGQGQLWDRIEPQDRYSAGSSLNAMGSNLFHYANYLCRRCRQAALHVWFLFEAETQDDETALFFTKVGHYPPFEINPPANLRKALDRDHLALYRRTKTLRHHGYGIGALAYVRRLVEELANEMLDLLVETLKETGGDRAAIERVRQAKQETVFEKKAKVAADALPASLRPGRMNPFTVLYDMPSEGLHRLSDEECCTIVDRVTMALEFIYVQLKVHVEEQKAYAEALKLLAKTTP